MQLREIKWLISDHRVHLVGPQLQASETHTGGLTTPLPFCTEWERGKLCSLASWVFKSPQPQPPGSVSKAVKLSTMRGQAGSYLPRPTTFTCSPQCFCLCSLYYSKYLQMTWQSSGRSHSPLGNTASSWGSIGLRKKHAFFFLCFLCLGHVS